MTLKVWISILFFFCSMLSAEQPPNYDRMREKMIREQIFQRGITNKSILRAFRKVKRHLFVKKELREKAYGDFKLDIGEDEHLNKPYIVAFMTYAVGPEMSHNPRPKKIKPKRRNPGRRQVLDKKVLEIGTGSGYHAAILGEVFRSVYTIELKESLGRQAKKRLDLLGYKNIEVKIGDGFKGWPEHAPFDAIIVTCPEDHIPQALIDQLAVGGRLIIPMIYSDNLRELVLLEKISTRSGDWKKTQLFPVDPSPAIKSGNNGKQKE